MSRGDAEQSGSSREVVLVIRARHIDYGVAQRSRSGMQWLEHGSIAMKCCASPTALAALLDSLRELPDNLLGEAGGAVLRIVVADAWLAAAIVPWSQVLLRPVAADAYARAQLAFAGHAITQQDRVVLDDAPYGAPRLAIAYPDMLIAFLERWACEGQARLVSLRALSVAACEHAWRGRAGFRAKSQQHKGMLVLDEGSLLVMRSSVVDILGRRHLDMLKVEQLSCVAGGGIAAELARHWQRLCMREPSWLELKSVQVLDISGAALVYAELPDSFERIDIGSDEEGTPAGLGGVNRRASRALDIRPMPQPWRWWQWGTLSFLAGGVLAASMQMLIENRTVRAMQHSLAAAEAPPVSPPKRAWSREDLARVPMVNAAIRQLNLPLDALSAALVPPRDIRVAVLSMETSSASQGVNSQPTVVKLTADACSSADMARYVGFVSERKPFTGAYLVHHELVASAPECPFRFVMEAQWVQ